MIAQVFIDFGSQLNILTRDRRMKLGSPILQRKTNYLKLVDQRFLEPINILKHIQTSIMIIPTFDNFKFINLFEGIIAYPASVGWPWGQNMRAIISLERKRIDLKGNNKNIVIPLDHHEGKP